MKKINSIHYADYRCTPVTVSCESTDGIGIYVLGMRNEIIKECLLRVCTALQSKGYSIPGKKIVISVSPVLSGGPELDLPIALAILAETGQITLPDDIGRWFICGELSQDASIRQVINPVIRAVTTKDCPIILPMQSASVLKGQELNEKIIFGVESLDDAIALVKGEKSLSLEKMDAPMPKTTNNLLALDYLSPQAMRATMISAVGNHNMTIIGAPNTAKSNISACLAVIKPEMTFDERMDMLSNCHDTGPTWTYRPVRFPHYSVSMNAFIEECRKSHQGVLHLEEFNRIPESVLLAIKKVQEDKNIVISRLNGRKESKADFQLVLSTTPCECGYLGEPNRKCTCSQKSIQAWADGIKNSPVISRSVQLWVHPVMTRQNYDLKEIQKTVVKAKAMQSARGQEESNATLSYRDLKVSKEMDNFLKELLEKLNIKYSAYMEVLRIARSIADLDGSKDIKKKHVSEAVGYQFLNKVKEEKNQ